MWDKDKTARALEKLSKDALKICFGSVVIRVIPIEINRYGYFRRKSTNRSIALVDFSNKPVGTGCRTSGR